MTRLSAGQYSLQALVWTPRNGIKFIANPHAGGRLRALNCWR